MFILRRKNCWCLGVIIFLIAIFSVGVSAVRINEVMPHSENDPDGEWIELYNDGNATNLTNWIISDEESDFIFNISLDEEGFLILINNITYFNFTWGINDSFKILEYGEITKGLLLNNGGDSILLYNESNYLMGNITYPSFSSHENETYSLLSNLSWAICDNPTPGYENNCSSYASPVDTEPEDAEIYLEMEWDEDEIINGVEFEIELKFYNLDENEEYDVKVWIEFEDNDTIISERYDDEDEEWKAGNYYVYNFISGEINETKDIKIRIKEDYNHFFGEGNIFFKLKNEDVEIEDYIEILEGKAPTGVPSDTELEGKEDDGDEETIATASSEVISLNGAKDIKSEENSENKVYRSKTQYIKEYAIYVFALFCVGVIILLIIKR